MRRQEVVDLTWKQIDLDNQLLGHENLSTTSVYTHVDFAQKKKAVEIRSILQ
jgi:site-specific recombinase XerD